MNSTHRRFCLLVILFGTLLMNLPSRVNAQLIRQDTDTLSSPVRYVILPAFAYTSDLGLIGGLIGQRVDYGTGDLPFENSSMLSVIGSTKGFLSFQLSHDRLRSFNRNIRSQFDLRAQRFLNQNYFGIGNNTGFDRSDWDDGYYSFEHRELRFLYTARRPLAINNRGGRLDALFTVETLFNSPERTDDNSLYASDQPYGRSGGWALMPGVGFIYEKRDNEFDTRRGMRYELSASVSPSFIGSYGYGKLSLDLRNYIPLLPDVVLAHQFTARHTTGDVPFWDLSVIGSEYELRGYAEDRFLGNSSWASVTELRAWLFHIESYNIRLGIHGFWDTGRVFNDGDSIGDGFKDLKQTVGVGGAMSLFNPDFIFRWDVGFSDEMYRVYVGIGYLF